jgi:S1-C subfamily serine protease
MSKSEGFWKLVVFGILIGVASSLLTAGIFFTWGDRLYEKTPPILEQKVILVNESLSQEAIVSAIFEQVKDSVVHIVSVGEFENIFGIKEKSERTGSGMIIDSSGLILTNQHVVEDADEVRVILSNGDEWKAEVIGADLVTDTAVLKIDPSYDLKPVILGDSDNIVPGQISIAVGNPYVLENTITVGVISAVNRTLSNDGYKIYGVIQTDAAINPGNSGGPLLNSKGEVIGITSAIFTVSGGFQGIGFAIPINTAKQVAEELIERGKVIRPWLGITGRDLTEELSETLGIPITSGALVIEVEPGGPAYKAGLKGTESSPFEEDFILGDVIVEIAGEKISSMDDLIEVLFKKQVGERIEIKYWREGEIYTTEVILGERPK